MDMAQTEPASDTAAAPMEERTARRLRLLARLADMGMEIAEATRTEAVEAPQPGVDYCARFAAAARAVRLTLLLEEKMARPEEERRRKAAARRQAVAEEYHEMRVGLAIAAAIDASAESQEAGDRLGREVMEAFERPEVAERIETAPAPLAVAELCEQFGLPEEVERWLEAADDLLEALGFVPSEDDEADEPRRAGRSRKPRAPDTG
ncbi:hypothetical protein [Inquilinus limosus]|uniref:hypothetical protein n=1 Tax=Inquilinus limosus TaxID=171674 RepID=UPI00041572DF|nr:hypothetical protein [Inquilinus limosus]